jgi:hypothetical protein
MCAVLDYNKLRVETFYVEHDVGEKYDRQKYADGDAGSVFYTDNIEDFNAAFGTYESRMEDVETSKERLRKLLSGVMETKTGITSASPPSESVRKFLGLGRKRHTRKRRSTRK